MEKFKLISIIGPTAVGKTAFSIRLAKKLRTEIISGDSMLVYSGFDVGAAKPNQQELSEVKHHLIDILPPDAKYNVMDFCVEAKKIIEKLNNKGKIPILAGGTGLYVKALIEGYEFSENNTKSTESYFLKTGELLYNAFVIGLRRERAALYERINKRVDLMVTEGLFEEVERLLKNAGENSQAMQGIGYKETVLYLKNEISQEEAIENIKKNTRHFAKRQFTWYKKMPYINWYDLDNIKEDEIFDKIYFDTKDFFN